MKVHEIYFKEYHCKVEGMKLDLKNAFLAIYQNKYRTRAIITSGLYIFTPIFEVHFFVFKVFSENFVLMYG